MEQYLEPGRTILAEYLTDLGVQHARLILKKTTAATMEAITGEVATDDDSPIRWILTPDGDVYPEELSSPPLRSLFGFDKTGARVPLSRRRIGGKSDLIYGFAPAGPGSVELTVDTVLKACNAAAETDQLTTAAAAPPPLPLTGPSVTVGAGTFPTLEVGQSWRWRCAERLDPGTLSATQWIRTGDSLIEADNGGLYEVGTDTQEADKEEGIDGAGENDEFDARVMTIARGVDGIRHRPFREAVGMLTETPWDGWPIGGPRTALWCLKFISENDIHPRARHTRWRHDVGLSANDAGVSEHEMAMRLVEHALCFDQLQVCELASLELVPRPARGAEAPRPDRPLRPRPHRRR